jgi:hypothetical protein
MHTSGQPHLIQNTPRLKMSEMWPVYAKYPTPSPPKPMLSSPSIRLGNSRKAT